MPKYQTKFKLDVTISDTDTNKTPNEYLNPTDFSLLEFLIEDMKNDSQYKKEIHEYKNLQYNNMKNIKWHLNNDNRTGYVEVVTDKDLNNNTLSYLADWIGGQNSDGLGESFEQHFFGSIDENDPDFEDYLEYNEFTHEYELKSSMASFDYNTNDYKLSKIE